MSLFDGKMNVLEAAKYVGCSPSFLRQRAKSGVIPSSRLGNRYLFDKKTLNAAFAASEPHNARAESELSE